MYKNCKYTEILERSAIRTIAVSNCAFKFNKSQDGIRKILRGDRKPVGKIIISAYYNFQIYKLSLL